MKKIKIMHIVYIFELGGIETFILQLCNNMDFDKYENYVITMTNENLGQIHLFDNRVNVINLNIKQGKIKTFLGFFQTLNKLKRAIKDIQPDVIHTHHEHYVTLFIQLASKLSKENIINIRTVHSGGSFYTSQENLSDKIKLFIEKLTFKLFDINLIAVSQAIHQNNLKYFGKLVKDNILIYNGVDLNRFDKDKYKNIQKKEFGFENTNIIYTYISRLNPGKNHEYLVNIWQKIIDELPNALLVFAGDGPLKKELEDIIFKNKLGKNIILLGSIDNVPELLSISDIGVFPSLYEGMSIALLEKFAMELPVVASDIEAFTNVANNNFDSFLISLNEEDKFIEKLIELGKNKEFCNQIGKNAYSTAIKYSLQNTIKSYENYYEKKVATKNNK